MKATKPKTFQNFSFFLCLCHDSNCGCVEQCKSNQYIDNPCYFVTARQVL